MRTLVVFTTRRVQFAYAVAHELRTPLTTFRLYTDMLAAGLVPESSRQEYLDTLNRESKRLGDLVNGVLEYARLEHRAVHRKAARVCGADIAERLRQDYAPSCAEDRVKLVVEDRLPADQSIETDLDLLRSRQTRLNSGFRDKTKSASTVSSKRKPNVKHGEPAIYEDRI